jgi:hypothetical protein
LNGGEIGDWRARLTVIYLFSTRGILPVLLGGDVSAQSRRRNVLSKRSSFNRMPKQPNAKIEC